MYELHQFVSSHFNEKARWTLDFKGLTHKRTSYLPGPHRGPIMKLTGQTATPALQSDEECIAGSAAIIDFLERHHPQPALYPADPKAKAQALAHQAHYDSTVGPAVRTAAFSIFVNDPGYLAATFSAHAPMPKRWGYRAMVPFVLPLIKKANGVTPENVQQANKVTAATLDDLARMVGKTGYIGAGDFTVADLTAAALLAPIADLDHADMRRFRPMPDALAEFLAGYASHEAIAWVRDVYERHRPPPRTS